MITLFYSCDLCGLTDVALEVRERPAEEDVRVWMDGVVRAVWVDHARQRPDCHPTEMKNLKIPMTGRQWVGGPVIQ